MFAASGLIRSWMESLMMLMECSGNNIRTRTSSSRKARTTTTTAATATATAATMMVAASPG